MRKRIWIPLLERAGVRYRDMYSFRWTFVSLARSSGEAAFNVSRIIGHARSKIVDDIYAHTVESGIAGVSESVAERAGFTVPKEPMPPSPPEPPTPPHGPSEPARLPEPELCKPLRERLRVIEGGRRAPTAEQPQPRPAVGNQRDGRKSVENAPAGRPKGGTST